MRNLYISDLHFGHKNIIKYSQRPFSSVDEMNETLLYNLEEALEGDVHLYCLGDVCFNLPAFLETCGWVDDVHKLTLIVGNHDAYPSSNKYKSAYERSFGRLIGTSDSWKENTLIVEDTMGHKPVKLLLSHDPQKDLQGCDFNLYGHHHSNLLLYPERFPAEEWGWLLDSNKHFNVGVELINYKPRSFAELVSMRNELGLKLK